MRQRSETVSVAIRDTLIDDLGVLHDIDRRSHSHPWTKQQILDSLEAGHLGLLLLVEDEAAGFAFFSCVCDEAELLLICVDRARQGLGCGAQLLEAGLQRLRCAGVQRCLLEVREDNTVARRLYEKRGFVEAGRRKNYYGGGAGAQRCDAILMEIGLES